MLSSPCENLIAAAKQLKINFMILTEHEAQVIRSGLTSKFASGHSRWLWANLREPASIQNANGWRLLDDYIAGNPFIVLFDYHDYYKDKRMVKFDSGSKLTPVLEECFDFEFYITDHQTSYVLCFNHHDFLIGTGKARDWIVLHSSSS